MWTCLRGSSGAGRISSHCASFRRKRPSSFCARPGPAGH
jgi:hypothetical protein